jgi:hypothetical protein
VSMEYVRFFVSPGLLCFCTLLSKLNDLISLLPAILSANLDHAKASTTTTRDQGTGCIPTSQVTAMELLDLMAAVFKRCKLHSCLIETSISSQAKQYLPLVLVLPRTLRVQRNMSPS